MAAAKVITKNKIAQDSIENSPIAFYSHYKPRFTYRQWVKISLIWG
jgi:hypothetical protein